MKYRFPFAWIALTAVVGCAATGSQDSASVEMPPSVHGTLVLDQQRSASGRNSTPAAGPARRPEGPTDLLSNRMVIRSADFTIRVKDAQAASQRAEGSIRGMGGYVDSSSASDLQEANPSVTMSLRVPVRRFEDAVGSLRSLGTVLATTTGSEDVTTQVVDLDARTKSMLAQETALQNLLQQAKRVQDIITIQDRLSDLRGQIESLQGQRKTLSEQSAYSTIALTLQQSSPMLAAAKDPNWMAQTWVESSSNLAATGRSIAVAGIWLVVFSPLWGTPVWLLARMRRSRRRAVASGSVI